MRRWLAVLAALGAMLFLAGCDGSKSSGTPASGMPEAVSGKDSGPLEIVTKSGV